MPDQTLDHPLPVHPFVSKTNSSQGKRNTYCSYRKSIREGIDAAGARLSDSQSDTDNPAGALPVAPRLIP